MTRNLNCTGDPDNQALYQNSREGGTKDKHEAASPGQHPLWGRERNDKEQAVSLSGRAARPHAGQPQSGSKSPSPGSLALAMRGVGLFASLGSNREEPGMEGALPLLLTLPPFLIAGHARYIFCKAHRIALDFQVCE